MANVTTKRFAAWVVGSTFLPTIKSGNRRIEALVKLANIHRGNQETGHDERE
jgi:hypothetical protein